MAGHLRGLRLDKKLTMRKLADEIQTAHSFIGKIEKQDRRMDVGEFILYCEAMECDPIDVLKTNQKEFSVSSILAVVIMCHRLIKKEDVIPIVLIVVGCIGLLALLLNGPD